MVEGPRCITITCSCHISAGHISLSRRDDWTLYWHEHFESGRAGLLVLGNVLQDIPRFCVFIASQKVRLSLNDWKTSFTGT